jgi:hypothetical protein
VTGVVLFGIAVAVIALFGMSGNTSIARAIRKAPRRTIAEFPEATPARLVGKVMPGEHLNAPLTGRACVFYEAIVEERPRNRGMWRTIIHETRGTPFTVDDGTGTALVDPAGARLAVVNDATYRSGRFDDATPVEEAFLARHGVTSTGWFLNKTLRYREGAIEIGETVAVRGIAVREPDPDGAARATGYRDAPPTRLRLSSSPRLPLLISDFDDAKA